MLLQFLRSFAILFVTVFAFEMFILPVIEAQLFNDPMLGFWARISRRHRIKNRQKDRRKILKKTLGRKNYKQLYDKQRGVFPGAFGLLESGKGALGLKELGDGGLNGLSRLSSLGGLKMAVNAAGRNIDITGRLGSDLFGRYGLLSPAGIDDLANGALGDALFNPGAIVGLDRTGKQYAAHVGLASGPAIAAATLADSMRMRRNERLVLMTGASLGGLGLLGQPGIGLGAAAGGLSAAAAGAEAIGTGIGAGIGAGISAGFSALPVLGSGALASAVLPIVAR